VTSDYASAEATAPSDKIRLAVVSVCPGLVARENSRRFINLKTSDKARDNFSQEDDRDLDENLDLSSVGLVESL
jgi:hypothetical protein